MSENNTNQTQTQAQAQTQSEPEITLTLTPDELQEENQKQLADLEAKSWIPIQFSSMVQLRRRK